MTENHEIYNRLMGRLTSALGIADFEARNREFKDIEAEANRLNQYEIVEESRRMRREKDFSRLAWLQRENRKEEALKLIAYIRKEWPDMESQRSCDRYERAINGE